MDPCAGCGKGTSIALRCGGCRGVCYCNSACQRRHWKSHKLVCAAPLSFASDPDGLPSDALLNAGDAAAIAEIKQVALKAAAGDTDAQFLMGHFLTWHPNTPHVYARGNCLLSEALRKKHPGAPFVLGRLAERGQAGTPQDVGKAAALYSAGFAANRHVGCAVGLHFIAERGLLVGGESLEAATARLVALATAPDVLAVADSTGSRSCLGDALWTAYKALGAAAEVAGKVHETAEERRLIDESLRVLDIGAATGDCYMMCDVAQSLIRPEVGHGGITLVFGTSERGEKLCSAVLASGRADNACRSRASSLLACVADMAGDKAMARKRYLFAVDVCGACVTDADKWAIIMLPMFLFEGIGGPPMPERAETILALGCQREIGPCLELAAQRTMCKDAATALWRRAAAVKMPLAWSIIHGITFEEAEEAIGGPALAVSKVYRSVGATAQVVGGQGMSGRPGNMSTSSTEELVNRLMLTCDSCGRVGSAATVVNTSAAPSSTPAAAAGSAGASAEVCKRAAVGVILAALEDRYAERDRDGEGGSFYGPSQTPAAHRKLIAAMSRARPPVPLFCCERCRCVFYCSTGCQKQMWPEHKLDCKLWRKEVKEQVGNPTE